MKVQDREMDWPIVAFVGLMLIVSLLIPSRSLSVNYVVSSVENTVLIFDWGARIKLIGIILPKPDSLAQEFMRNEVVGQEIDRYSEPDGDFKAQDGSFWGYTRIYSSDGISDIAALLLDSGWALVDLRGDFSRQEEYIFRESCARRGRLGIWSGSFCVSVNPSDSDFYSHPGAFEVMIHDDSSSKYSDTLTVLLDVDRRIYHLAGCSEMGRWPLAKDRFGAMRRRPDLRACPICIKE